MSPQALGANKVAVITSHNKNCINFIPSTFLFVQRLNKLNQREKVKNLLFHMAFMLLRQCCQQQVKLVI